MKRKLRISLALGLLSVASCFLALIIYRWTRDYSEGGSYFDEETMTTYDEDALLVFGALTFIFIIPAVILLRSLRKAENQQ